MITCMLFAVFDDWRMDIGARGYNISARQSVTGAAVIVPNTSWTIAFCPAVARKGMFLLCLVSHGYVDQSRLDIQLQDE
jgi:hypothetical protein